jgi:hypothetical protein
VRKIVFAKLFLSIFLAALPGVAAGDSEKTEAPEDPARNQPGKITIGEVEDVIILPWGITLPARIDTGATMSALDARKITVRNEFAEFKLGSEYKDLPLRFPVIGWMRVWNAVGYQRRPVVEMDICLGPKLIRTRATLADRSQMPYPFLVGRSVLTGNFMVDTSRSRAARPLCAASPSHMKSTNASFLKAPIFNFSD